MEKQSHRGGFEMELKTLKDFEFGCLDLSKTLYENKQRINKELKAEAIKWVKAIRNKEHIKIGTKQFRILDDKTAYVVCRVIMLKNNLTEENN